MLCMLRYFLIQPKPPTPYVEIIHRASDDSLEKLQKLSNEKYQERLNHFYIFRDNRYSNREREGCSSAYNNQIKTFLLRLSKKKESKMVAVVVLTALQIIQQARNRYCQLCSLNNAWRNPDQ